MERNYIIQINFIILERIYMEAFKGQNKENFYLTICNGLSGGCWKYRQVMYGKITKSIVNRVSEVLEKMELDKEIANFNRIIRIDGIAENEWIKYSHIQEKSVPVGKTRKRKYDTEEDEKFIKGIDKKIGDYIRNEIDNESRKAFPIYIIAHYFRNSESNKETEAKEYLREILRFVEDFEKKKKLLAYGKLEMFKGVADKIICMGEDIAAIERYKKMMK